MSRSREARPGRLIAWGLVAFALEGCLPSAVTEQGRAVNDLWNVFLVPSIVVAAIVWGLTTFAILRYRRRGVAPHELPPQITGHRGLEVAWTVIPIATVAVLFAFTLNAVAGMSQRTEGGIEVGVSAFRWQWQFDYPKEGVTVVGLPDAPAEMVVPVGEPVHITLTSPDVIHSFFVPAFLFKRDAIPGHPTQFEFTIDQAGAYGGQCAEFCGFDHDRMKLTVRAVSRSDYEAWLAQRRASPGTSP
jgi:cytochrome c oxidase subunit II